MVSIEGTGYQIIDTVDGRDGSTYVESIERLRFLDGNTTTSLTYPPPAPGALEPVDKAADDDFVTLVKADGPEVLPGGFGPDPLDDGLLPVSSGVAGLRNLLSQMDGFINPLVIDGPDGPRLLHDRVGDHDNFGWTFGINPWS